MLLPLLKTWLDISISKMHFCCLRTFWPWFLSELLEITSIDTSDIPRLIGIKRIQSQKIFSRLHVFSLILTETFSFHGKMHLDNFQCAANSFLCKWSFPCFLTVTFSSLIKERVCIANLSLSKWSFCLWTPGKCVKKIHGQNMVLVVPHVQSGMWLVENLKEKVG